MSKEIKAMASKESLALVLDVVAWYEAEESCRGMNLSDLMSGIGRLTHSGKWHWQQDKPETNNPVWPIFTIVSMG